MTKREHKEQVLRVAEIIKRVTGLPEYEAYRIAREVVVR